MPNPPLPISTLEKTFSFFNFAIFTSLLCSLDLYLALFCQNTILNFSFEIFEKNILGILVFCGVFYAVVIPLLKLFCFDFLVGKFCKIPENYNPVGVDEMRVIALQLNSRLLYDEALRLRLEANKMDNIRTALVMVFVYLVAVSFFKASLAVGILTKNNRWLEFLLIYLPMISCLVAYALTAFNVFLDKEELEEMRKMHGKAL